MAPDECVLSTGLASLVRTDPFSLDRPSPEALVFRIVSSEMTMFDKPSSSVPAVEMDDLVLYMFSDRHGQLVRSDTAHLTHAGLMKDLQLQWPFFGTTSTP